MLPGSRAWHLELASLMELWHLTPDARRTPRRVSPGERVTLDIGSWPVEPGQSVWVNYDSEGAAPSAVREARAEAVWRYNEGENSYWRAEIEPLPAGTVVRYRVFGRSRAGEIAGRAGQFRVGPKLYLALLWHQHQPLYKDLGHAGPRGSYTQPWVRLHALRTTLEDVPAAFEALYAADGSDWFWWLGDDQGSGNDSTFDELFRGHLKNLYRALGAAPPPSLDVNLVPRRVLWTVTRPVPAIQPSDRLAIRTTCPGTITWWTATRPWMTQTLEAVGGVMGGTHHYEVLLGPVGAANAEVRFRLYCKSASRETHDQYCSEEERMVRVAEIADEDA